MAKTRPFNIITVSEIEKINNMKKSILCSGMDANEVQQLAPSFSAYSVDGGAEIYQEGDTEAFLCLIASGTVNIYKNYRQHNQKLLSTLGDGETVGEMAVIDERPRSASAVAPSKAIFYALTRRNLNELLLNTPTIWGKLIFNISALLCNRLRYTNDMLAKVLPSTPFEQTE